MLSPRHTPSNILGWIPLQNAALLAAPEVSYQMIPPHHALLCMLFLVAFASDSSGLPFIAVPNPPNHKFMTGISYAASSSSSARTSSPIDLQQKDRITTEHDETHASPAPGLLSTLATAASVARTILPSSSHQQQMRFDHQKSLLVLQICLLSCPTQQQNWLNSYYIQTIFMV